MWTLHGDILWDGVYQLCSSSFCYCLVCTAPVSHLLPQEYNLSLDWLGHKIRPFVLECRWIIQISIHGSQCISWTVVMFKHIRIWRPVLIQCDIIHPLFRMWSFLHWPSLPWPWTVHKRTIMCHHEQSGDYITGRCVLKPAFDNIRSSNNWDITIVNFTARESIISYMVIQIWVTLLFSSPKLRRCYMSCQS